MPSPGGTTAALCSQLRTCALQVLCCAECSCWAALRWTVPKGRKSKEGTCLNKAGPAQSFPAVQ